MDKYKENWITLVPKEVVECSGKGDEAMEKESELYNNVYKEISEIVGLDATLKIYLRFKGQQVSFPVRLYNPQLIQQNVIKEFDGTNVRELAKKYDYSEKTIRRMIRDSVELVEGDDSYDEDE
jgi:Mor family transcriptional regulator